MRVLLLIYAFPPEITGSGHLYYELAQDLISMGHQVIVLAPIPRQRMGTQTEVIREHYGRRLLVKENINGVQALRTAVLPISLNNPLTKGLDHFSVAFSQWIGGQFGGKPDVILAYSPPLPLGLTGYLLARQYGVPFVLNIQDIFPQYAIDAGILTNSTAIAVFRKMEQFLYTKVDAIIVHSEGNRNYLQAKGVPISKLTVVHNWGNIKRITPGPRNNGFRQEHRLDNDFVVSYAGTMGWAQDLGTVVNAATYLKKYKDIVFLLVGDGPRRSELEEKSKRLGLSNVRFLPLQPRAKFPLLLQASDVCLISLNPGLSTPVVPGKLMDIMAAGRPVAACVPLNGDAPRIVQEAQCGMCIEAGDAKGLAEIILRFYENRDMAELLGRNGRSYVQKHFLRAGCTERFENVLKSVTQVRRGRDAGA